MELQDVIRGVQPLVGQVTPIKTVQETQPAEEFADAYVAEVNLKCASKVIKVLDSKFPRNSLQPMSHLRRFAKHSNLPGPLRPTLLKDPPSPQTIFVLISPPLPDIDQLQDLLAPFAPTPERDPASPSAPQSSDSTGQIDFHIIKVPVLPPLNTSQAEKWSETMWPVIFNPAAARATVAPPVQILNRIREFIQPCAGRYLALARKVAEEAERLGLGRGVGAVVVDPEITTRIQKTEEEPDFNWSDAIVAVAGDGRYSRREAGALSEAEIQLGIGPNPARETYNPDLEGGPDLHALMRAVEIIAYKRRAEDPAAESDKPHLTPFESYFISQPDLTASDSDDMSPVPEKYQKIGTDSSASAVPVLLPGEDVPAPRIRPRSQGGYLCTDLDVYLTHEPCICCCMGLLLSRFRAVVFPRRGRMVTGGLASEPVVKPEPVTEESIAAGQCEQAEEGTKEHKCEKSEDCVKRLYYGIHWRKELNWRALGYEFVEAERSETGMIAEGGIAFHA